MSQSGPSFWDLVKNIVTEFSRIYNADYIVQFSNGERVYVTKPEYQLLLAEPEIRRNIVHVDKNNL